MALSEGTLEMYVLKDTGEHLFYYNLRDHNQEPKNEPVFFTGILSAVNSAIETLFPEDNGEGEPLKFSRHGIKCRVYEGKYVNLAVLLRNTTKLPLQFKTLIQYISQKIIRSLESKFEKQIMNGEIKEEYKDEIEYQINMYKEDYQVVYYKHIISELINYYNKDVAMKGEKKDKEIKKSYSIVKECEELMSSKTNTSFHNYLSKLKKKNKDVENIINESHDRLGVIWDLLKLETL